MKTTLLLILILLLPIGCQTKKQPQSFSGPGFIYDTTGNDGPPALTEKEFEQFKKDLTREAGLVTADNEAVFVGMEIYKDSARWTITKISISHKEIQVNNSEGKQMFLSPSELKRWTSKTPPFEERKEDIKHYLITGPAMIEVKVGETISFAPGDNIATHGEAQNFRQIFTYLYNEIYQGREHVVYRAKSTGTTYFAFSFPPTRLLGSNIPFHFTITVNSLITR